MKARARLMPLTVVKLPMATSRVPSGLTANRYTRVGPALVATEPAMSRLM